MKTKLLLGSIGAVIILILVSFTNVVGVQSTTSGSVNESPLFRIRTTRANSENSKDALTSNYLGKGLNAIQFPLRDTRQELIQKSLEIIITMDDDTFNGFIVKVIQRMINEGKLKDVNTQSVLITLHQLKDNPDAIKSYIDIIKDDRKPENLTWENGATCMPIAGCWFGYILWNVIVTLAVIIIIIYGFINDLFSINPLTHTYDVCP